MSRAMTKAELLELVGHELGKSAWFAIDQARIDQFVRISVGSDQQQQVLFDALDALAD